MLKAVKPVFGNLYVQGASFIMALGSIIFFAFKEETMFTQTEQFYLSAISLVLWGMGFAVWVDAFRKSRTRDVESAVFVSREEFINLLQGQTPRRIYFGQAKGMQRYPAWKEGWHMYKAAQRAGFVSHWPKMQRGPLTVGLWFYFIYATYREYMAAVMLQDDSVRFSVTGVDRTSLFPLKEALLHSNDQGILVEGDIEKLKVLRDNFEGTAVWKMTLAVVIGVGAISLLGYLAAFVW